MTAISTSTLTQKDTVSVSFSKEEVLRDYRCGWESRHASLLGRKEALLGKAKFGIFGDGKEVPQLAMAKAFRPGDFRSGYYRDQTFMFAVGMASVEEFFSQLYAHPDVAYDPFSAGRQMNSHFASRTVEPDGGWRDLTSIPNCAADSSPTGSQMPRLVGLAYASRLYRELPELAHLRHFSNRGDEITFGTIGNGSCAEGMFWEAINAVGVLKAPLLMSIWDDDYGISVSNEHQVTKEDLSELLSGFRRRPGDKTGYELYTFNAWDYPALCEAYVSAAEKMRRDHIPALFHIVGVTQPQGHSTSGSHERYKSKERLEWEREHDCLVKMREWIESEGLVSTAELDAVEQEAKENTRRAQERAWGALVDAIHADFEEVERHFESIAEDSRHGEEIHRIRNGVKRHPFLMRRHLMSAIHQVIKTTRTETMPARRALIACRDRMDAEGKERYNTHLYSETPNAALLVDEIPAVYGEDAPTLNGFEILQHCFDAALERCPELIAFGEDVGALGDVNQGLAGLQKKFGELRVSDTGIRECTIVGQAIGMAMRGLRPLAEIQYLDYILYALEILSDDLATLQWRTKGRQKAPVLIRTRGHRLEGMWHAGSPMAGLLNLVRGLYLCVPRDMTQAAGFYNTMLRSDDSAIVIEVLNGYRLKERLPSNIADLTIPLGVPEVIRSGSDVTLVTYGACCRLALQACEELAEVGIEAEVIDVRTLLPFDRPGIIGESLKKTSRIVFLDEDVPGGGTAYMMQQVLEGQKGYAWLDSEPRTLSAEAHRPPYGSEGDFWTKPGVESIFTTVYELLHEAEPARFPIFYR